VRRGPQRGGIEDREIEGRGAAAGSPAHHSLAPVAQEDDQDRLEKSIAVAAPPHQLFTLLTDPDGLSRWLTPVASFDAVPGGDVELVFLNQNGTLGVFRGQVTEVVPSERIGYTWHSPAWTFPPLQLLFTLHPIAGGTEVRLTQWGFAGQPVERTIHDQGWEHYLGRLAEAAGGLLHRSGA
jgi:uncharacterized protein YndB with AHSA1/START domain